MRDQAIATRAFHRTILMTGFHMLVSLFCSNKIKDTQCGFKLFTHETAYKLFPNIHIEGWAFDIELIYLSEKLGIPIDEINVKWTEIPGSKLIKGPIDIVTNSLSMARDIVCIFCCYTFGIWKFK